MKNAELIALMISNTNKTRNVRTYGKRWFSGGRRICDKIATKIGKMIALIQHRIDCGEIIDRNSQSLLVYNFQPLYSDTNTAYITIDMLIKPYTEIHDTHNLSGLPFQLVVDAFSCEVMNNARAMLLMGLEHEVDTSEDPQYYGNYSTYKAICSYMTICHTEELKAEDIFAGKYDSLPPIQNSVVMDSFVEARDFLETNWSPYSMIAELNYAKEDHPTVLASCRVGCHMIKIIHPHRPQVEVSNMLTTEPKEDRVDDEVSRLLDAHKEAPAVADFGTADQ